MEKKLACGDSETDEISCEPSDSNDSINARKSLRRVFYLMIFLANQRSGPNHLFENLHRERISKLRDSIKTDKHKVSDINVE